MKYVLLVLSLSTESATTRMRAWRALKSSGAAVLRDGAYLLPDVDGCRTTLSQIAEDVRENGGSAYLISADEDPGFPSLFDRSGDFGQLLEETQLVLSGLTPETVGDAMKSARKLRKAFAALVAIDFFPGEAQKQADAGLLELEQAGNQALSPDEPHAVAGEIVRLDPKAYVGKTWATRRRPWVDRLASAWLIRRYIDADAKILWLESPDKCPAKALGFDFDGARFSHVGAKVTFEVLLASFGFEIPELKRLGALVHYLDVGGIQPPEAAGIESVLAGMRSAINDDDQLLQAACAVFDGLIVAFVKESQS
ncbi:MAG: chromate resistance protein [Rhodocyclaceae bacterium]|nr:chromate resistance protein [Rhodocyclaceae bacterium]